MARNNKYGLLGIYEGGGKVGYVTSNVNRLWDEMRGRARKPPGGNEIILNEAQLRQNNETLTVSPRTIDWKNSGFDSPGVGALLWGNIVVVVVVTAILFFFFLFFNLKMAPTIVRENPRPIDRAKKNERDIIKFYFELFAPITGALIEFRTTWLGAASQPAIIISSNPRRVFGKGKISSFISATE